MNCTEVWWPRAGALRTPIRTAGSNPSREGSGTSARPSSSRHTRTSTKPRCRASSSLRPVKVMIDFFYRENSTTILKNET
jgi:hypothetical protein